MDVSRALWPGRKRHLTAAALALAFSAVVGIPIHRSHVLLEERGVAAPARLLSYDEGGVTLVLYQFRTADGRVIRVGGKTSEDRAYYETLEMVYVPQNPERYEEKPVFDGYSRVWMAFFFGVLVPGVVGLMISGPLRLVSALSDASPGDGEHLRGR